VGMLAGAAAARLVGGAMGSDPNPSVYFAGAWVCAIAGPLVGMVAAQDVALAARADEILGCARVGSLEWVAGALLGAPIGARWFHSAVERGGEASGARARA